MIKRTIEISNQAHLSVKDKQLTIKKEEKTFSIPLEDIGVIILESSEITLSQRLLVGIAHNDITLLICDEKHMPLWLYHPLFWHSQSSKFIQLQIQSSSVIQKQLWKKIIEKKILHQAFCLERLGRNASWLKNIAWNVKSWDSDNREGYAANIYWKELFWSNFNRREEHIYNTMLNYWYALLRATVARAVVASGLHPSLWIFHKNQFNAFNLVDDLIEPLRPLVDYTVYEIIENHDIKDKNTPISPSIKRILLEILALSISYNNKKLPINIAIEYYTSSFRESLENNNILIIPDIFDEK